MTWNLRYGAFLLLPASCCWTSRSYHPAHPYHPARLQALFPRSRKQRVGEAPPPLTLYHAPLRTLYYFVLFAWRGFGRNLRWGLGHPIALFILLPAAAAYFAAKQTSYAPSFVSDFEVRPEGGGAHERTHGCHMGPHACHYAKHRSPFLYRQLLGRAGRVGKKCT